MGDEDKEVGGAEPSRGEEAGVAVQGVVYDVANEKEAGSKEGDEHADPVCPFGASFDADKAYRHSGSTD